MVWNEREFSRERTQKKKAGRKIKKIERQIKGNDARKKIKEYKNECK